MVSVGAAGAANITFSSIPSTYKHLQLRYLALPSTSGTKYSTLRLNGDTTTANYRYHFLNGDGGTATAGSAQNAYSGVYYSTTAGGVAIIDILDYSNTNKNTTTRELNGSDNNGSGEVMLISNLWMNTAAVSSITLAINSGNFAQHSSFALYGIKGA
jgi:hypothetical protein